MTPVRAHGEYELATLLWTIQLRNASDRPVEVDDVGIPLQMKLNLACRGVEPAYYWLGSDYRGSGNASYTLSYMAQMGGWAVEDYALNFAQNPVSYLRLGYASYLSSWALLNSGTAESTYGFWYPGKENDGGAGGGFEPRPWGQAWLGNKEMGRGSWWYSGEIDLGFSAALRMAATVVSDDPIFGLFAYGGDLTQSRGEIQVIPKDGLRARFYIVRSGYRFQMELDRDGFARDQPIAFNDSYSQISFLIERPLGRRSRNDDPASRAARWKLLRLVGWSLVDKVRCGIRRESKPKTAPRTDRVAWNDLSRLVAVNEIV